jgi:ribosome-associated protein
MQRRNEIRLPHGVTIPLSELDFAFSRSSGPGGQHVNKTATQVELVFDVAGSPSLPSEAKRRIRGALRSYITRDGVLRLTCQSTRSQHRNREEAIERFRALMAQGLRVPKRRKRTKRTRASIERRIAEKKRRSQLKRQRRFRPDDA